MTIVRNIVAQLDTSPRLSYALRTNPRILFNSFLTVGSSQPKDDVQYVGPLKFKKDAQPPFRSHTLRSGCLGFGTLAAEIYSEFIRGFSQLRQECIGIVPQIRS